MPSRNGILALTAAGTSLLLHAAVLSSFRTIRLEGAGTSENRAQEMTVVFDAPPEAGKEKPAKKDKPADPEFIIGEVGAKGYAHHSVSGDRTAVARPAEVDQAALSLDPVGNTPFPETPGDAGAGGGGPSTPESAPPPAPQAAPRPRTTDLGESLRPMVLALRSVQARLPELLEKLPAPLPRPPPGSVSPPAPAAGAAPAPAAGAAPAPALAAPAAPAPAPSAQELSAPQPPRPPNVTVVVTPPPGKQPAGDPGRGGADPAPQSDSEADAFSVLGSMQYRDGRLSVRDGRKVRSRRPKINIAGKLDLYQRAHPEVTLWVATDETGKVTAVDVLKSSGSNEIDQPCRVALYDWWFEPKKNAAGKPVPDKFQFTICFH